MEVVKIEHLNDSKAISLLQSSFPKLFFSRVLLQIKQNNKLNIPNIPFFIEQMNLSVLSASDIIILLYFSATTSNILMNRVQSLIIQALTTADNNQLRQQAENTIFSLLRDNPSEFFFTCANIVADESKANNLRQQAATVMKAVLPKRTDNGEYFWDLAEKGVRGQVKHILLANLISPNVQVMRAGANVIAQIAAIEIVRNEWLDIVNSLADNSMHEELIIRRASITTLGFICEELKHARSNINFETCQQILGSLLLGLRQQNELVEISLSALRESIAFLRNILQNHDYSSKVFEYILPLLTSSHTQKVYEVLFEYGKYCYHLLAPYLSTIVQFTIDHIRLRSEASILALEFWDTVGTEYLKRADNDANRVGEQAGTLRNFLEELQDLLLPEVMQAILILSKEDLNFSDFREVAVKTLGTFVNCCGRNVVDKVTDGVSRVLSSANAGERQASALIFSSLCFYGDKDYIQTCFKNGFPHLILLIGDPEPLVCKNTLAGFVTLSEYFPQVFLTYQEIYQFFLHLLDLSQKNDEDIQILSLTVLINITDFLREHQNCQLTEHPDPILQRLVKTFTSNLSYNLNKQSNEKILALMMNVLMAAKKKSVLVMLVQHLISLYIQTNNSNLADRKIALSQIITIIHTCMLSLSKFPPQPDLKSKLYDLIDMHLNINGIEQEGINMIGVLALTFKRDFLQDQFDKYWNIVMQGLELVDQKSIFKATLNTIADISRCDEEKIANKLIPVFQLLVNHMHNSSDREIKIQILNCFGDLSIGMKSYGDTYVKTLIQICNECFEAIYKFSQIEQERDYAEELKQALIDMYHCVVFAQNESMKINKKLAEHFPIVSSFIVRTCDISLKPTVEYLRVCLFVIFDSALFYARSQYAGISNKIVKSSEVQNLVNIIRKFRGKKEVDELLTFIDDKIGMRVR